MDPHASGAPPPPKMSRVARGGLPDSASRRKTAEQLLDAAAAACARAEEGMEAAIRRRSMRATLTPEVMERIEHTTLRLEMVRSSREMRHADLETARRMRAEERETAELERWIQAQAASMLALGSGRVQG